MKAIAALQAFRRRAIKMGKTYNITVNCDRQKCIVCGKSKKGCHLCNGTTDKYICYACVLDRIKAKQTGGKT